MQLSEFIDTLNLPFNGNIEEDVYIINVSDSNAWDRMFIIIESNPNLTLAEDDTTALLNNGNILFRNNEGTFSVRLVYNFTDDLYQCRIEEIHEEIS